MMKLSRFNSFWIKKSFFLSFPGDIQSWFSLVQITGSFQSVYDALLHITGRIRELTFPGKSPGIGSSQYLSASHDAPPALTRCRSELTSSGGYSSSGFSHGLDRFGGLGHGQSRSQSQMDWQSPRSRSLERAGVSSADRVPYFHGSEARKNCQTKK